jgi:hypothetical protein
MIKSALKTALVAACLFSVLGLGGAVLPTLVLIADAEAATRAAHRHHHQTTARRTTRRVIRSTHVYVNHLPAGCTTVIVDGTRLHHCGRTYYRPHGNRYVVVVIE